jgi:hypothetical protein
MLSAFGIIQLHGGNGTDTGDSKDKLPLNVVTPAKAGVQYLLDSGFRRNDGLTSLSCCPEPHVLERLPGCFISIDRVADS